MSFEPWYNHHGWPGAQSPPIKSFPGLFWWVHNNNAPIYRRPGLHSFISEVKAVVPFTEFWQNAPYPSCFETSQYAGPNAPSFLYPSSSVEILKTDDEYMTNYPAISASLSESWVYVNYCLKTSNQLSKTPFCCCCCLFALSPCSLWKPAFPNEKRFSHRQNVAC